MKRTTYKDICYHAAASIAESRRDYACSALHTSLIEADVTDISKWHLHTVFVAYFYSGECPPGELWFGDSTIEENRMARSLALLFLAEFVELE